MNSLQVEVESSELCILKWTMNILERDGLTFICNLLFLYYDIIYFYFPLSFP